jgi:hypothetical protein
MPVVSNVLDTTARMTFQTGVDAEGNPILKNRSYGNVKAGAADQDIYDVCQIMAGLQENTLVSIRKVVETELVESL